MLFLEPVTPGELRAHPTISRLNELGWRENKTLMVQHALAQADIERLATLAQGLVRDRVDVIWVDEYDAALAAARATRTIPVVFCGVAQPAEQGLVGSLARPGGNVTGVANTIGVGVSTRRLTMLKEIEPRARRLAWVFPRDSVRTATGKEDFAPWEAEARKIGYDPVIYPVYQGDDFDKTLGEILRNRAEVVSVGESPFLLLHRERIVRFVNDNRMPSAFFSDSFVDAGGLVSYGPDRIATRRKSAEYIDRILRGEQPANMPVEQPTRFVTVLNLRTAKLLSLTIPQSLRVQVDRVIE